ncbi:DUF2125 domain-containing protein [Pseudooceanicola sp. LIPI14-2-Ac024]|uniref:DUF2125 domain-containing protein n=1 Tax=Pseudooceanicola sp. LIPI14-2-Ac024 TaxID=3344875 RepID=UPI0035D11C80
MKRLFTIIAVILVTMVVAWTGYWFFAAGKLESAYANWFDARRADGWQAEYSDLSVGGFPYRFDTTFTDLDIADPETGWAWTAPMFQIVALAYRPNEVIAIFPGDSTLSTPEAQYTITNDDLRASMRVGASSRLPLREARLVGSNIAVTEEDTLGIDTLRVAVELLPGATSDYRIGFYADGITLPDPFLNRVAGEVALPPEVTKINVDADVKFDAPWDLDALEDARPQPTHVRLRIAEAEWGPLKISATGELSIDEAGLPTGEIAIKAENWEAMLEVAVAAGAMSEGTATAITRGLTLVANLSGGRSDSLNATISFRNGRAFLGPVPLGPAPVLLLR